MNRLLHPQLEPTNQIPIIMQLLTNSMILGFILTTMCLALIAAVLYIIHQHLNKANQ